MAEERVQRRLAAILAADVVGYSRLMGAEEAETRARFNDHLEEIVRPNIDEHRGRLVKTIGDGFLVEFGSVVDAVQCAADVQNGVAAAQSGEPGERKLLFRVGVHLGDVIVEEEDIHGDGVNIAARLEALAEPGGICVSDMVYAGVRNKLSLDFIDLGKQSLKNIAYPVQVFRVVLDAADQGKAAATDALFRRPAVAVLPFENLSGDPDQEYFADGLTEDIITALSLWRSFPVIARNSTYAYKGQTPDVRQVGKELGVRYVIEGSVRKVGKRVRVTAQLVNSENGHHVWAERYDRELADIFELQDELSRNIAATVAPELEFLQAPGTRTKTPQNLEAWELVQRGYGHVFALDWDSIKKARECFERAIELEVDYARAYGGLAYSYHREVWLGYTDFSAETKKQLVDAASRAVSLDEIDAENHIIQTIACFWCHEIERGIAEAKRAVELNPTNVRAHQFLGIGLTLIGQPTQALSHMKSTIFLSPRDPRQGVWMCFIGLAYLTAREYNDSVEWSDRAIQRHAQNPDAHLILASSLGHLNRVEEAQAALRSYGSFMPHKLERPSLLWQYKHVADEEHLLDGLRKAGWEG